MTVSKKNRAHRTSRKRAERISTCLECGKENPQSNQFCGQCGDAVTGPPDHQPLSTPVAPGTIFEQTYRIREEIGRGGMGVVYRGFDLALQREVAIKVLPEQFNIDRRIIGRFKREARAMASLDHPNVIPIYTIGQQHGLHYFVMKYLHGVTVGQILNDSTGEPSRFTPTDVQRIIRDICLGLEHAHSRDLIHRDIKPSNIMLGPDQHVTIMDFGICKANIGDALTQKGQLFGTPEYLAPEHAHGRARSTPRTDIYSLGIVAFEMLKGQPPFMAETPYAVMQAHVEQPPASLLNIEGISDELDAIVQKAIAKWPANRFQSATEMADALEMLMPTERRAQQRVSINHEFSRTDQIDEYATDISISGCFIRSTRPLPIGTMVTLKFTLLEPELALIEGYGEVVRITEPPKSGMGIQFVALTKEARRHVEHLVAQRGRAN